MAGVGEILGAVGLLEPAFKACLETYGFYKLTRTFGEDYQKAERGLLGQIARLRLIGETRICDLLLVPEKDTQLAATTLWTLQEMRKNIEICETLMQKHGEPKIISGNIRTLPSNKSHPPSLTSSSDTLQIPSSESPAEKKSRGMLFSRRHKSSSSASSLASQSLSPSITEASQSPITSPSIMGSLDDPRVTKGILDNAMQARNLQISSTIRGRVAWAKEDRGAFFSAVEELTKANDLLESLLRIKSLEDPMFLPNVTKPNNSAANFISSTRSLLEDLHQNLLKINARSGRDIEFSLKLVLDDSDRNTYADHVDHDFDVSSSIFALQGHKKSTPKTTEKSYFLLAETPVRGGNEEPSIKDLTTCLQQIDSEAFPAFKCLGLPPGDHSQQHRLRIYQDMTAHWSRTQTLAQALENQDFQDISFQRHYSQLGVFMAFSYAVLPFTYRGKAQFPQPMNYHFYDQSSAETLESPSPSQHPSSRPDESATSEERRSTGPSVDAETALQELQSPYISFNFGSRPLISTKALGKRPGFTAPAQNPLVALGLLLYQIGSWRHMRPEDITKMRQDALARPQDLIRLSGVEFADITRTCLNWKETGQNGMRYDNENMLVKVYVRLHEYNKSLQALL